MSHVSSSEKTPNKRKDGEGTSSENAQGGTDPKRLKPTSMPKKNPAPDEHGGEVTTQEDRMGAVGGTDTGATGTRAFLYSHLSTKNAMLTYKRTWNFFSFPIAKQYIDLTLMGNYGQQSANKILTTSMAAFPTDLPYFYMSPAEYGLLPDETRVVKTFNKISVVHASTSFQANESNVANVTASNQLLLDYTKGAALKGVGSVVSYEQSSSNPMVPDSAKCWGQVGEHQSWGNKLYGASLKYPPGTAGVWVQMPAYLALHIDGNGSSTANGVIDTDHLYGSCNAVTNYNTDFMQHTQHYYNTYLTNQREVFVGQAYGVVPKTHSWPMKCRGVAMGASQINQDTLWEPVEHNTTKGERNVPKAYYESFVQPNSYRVGFKEIEPDAYPPWLYVGLREIPAISHSSFEYQDGVVYFQYECEMVVHCNFDSYTSEKPTKSYSDAVYTLLPQDEGNPTFKNIFRTAARFGRFPYVHVPTTKTNEDTDMVIV